MPNHDEIQTALSARIDGEPTGIADEILDAHLSGCEECQQFQRRALSLTKSMHQASVSTDAEMVPPQQLTENILAGVEPAWRRSARRAELNTIIARLTLLICGIGFGIWAVVQVVASGGLIPQSLDVHGEAVWDSSADPHLATALMEGAALRAGVSLGLLTAAWRPYWAAGVMPVVGAMGMFLTGFTIRDVVLGVATGEQILLIGMLIISALATAWLWLRYRYIQHRYVQLGSHIIE
ncbi:zf-HC2 domain-containing protein [Corynebacterium propinquum]